MRNKKLIYVALLTLIVLVAPALIRYLFFDNLPIGEQAYYHLNAAKTDAEFKTPYHYLMNYINPVILQVVLGLLSVILFYFMLKKLNFKNESFYACLVLVLSPIFIYTFTIISPHSLAVFLMILGSWLFIQDNKIISASAAIPFVLASYNIFNSLLILIILGSYILYKKEKIYLAASIAAIIVILSIYLKNPFLISYEIVSKTNFMERLLSDFGGLLGFSVFGLVLLIIGIAAHGKKKLYTYPLFIFFIIMFFVKPESTIYFNFLVAFFGGVGLYKISRTKWNINLIKDLILIVFVCGILFSAVSYGKILSLSGPDNNIKDSMEWLSEKKERVVFSHYSYGFIIRELANQNVIMDSMSRYADNYEELLNDSNMLLYSRNLEGTEKILKKHNIYYILIDKRMREMIWEGEEDGLLFLLKNPETFENVYSEKGVDIWRYKK